MSDDPILNISVLKRGYTDVIVIRVDAATVWTSTANASDLLLSLFEMELITKRHCTESRVPFTFSFKNDLAVNAIESLHETGYISREHADYVLGKYASMTKCLR